MHPFHIHSRVVHNILQCLCSQELIEPKLAATSAATSYSVFQPSEAPNSSAAAPLPAADPTPKLSSAAVASTSPEAAAAVPKAVAEAVAVPETPPVTALGPDTDATVRSKAAGKTFDWYKVGDLAQDWQARAKPPRSNAMPPMPSWSHTRCRSSFLALASSPLLPVARPPRSCFWSCAE